jgi:hypothetical protein
MFLASIVWYSLALLELNFSFHVVLILPGTFDDALKALLISSFSKLPPLV